MRAFSRCQRRHPLAMLLVGASIGSACWLAANGTPAWAQNAESSTGSIRILKGAGPFEYAPVSTGIQLRLLKGVERTDYVLPPPIVGQTLPSPILRASANLPSEGDPANQGSRSESFVLPAIQETHREPTSVPGRGHSAMSSVEKAMHESGNNQPSLTRKDTSSSAPTKDVSLRNKPPGASAPRSHHPGANGPEPASSTNALRLTKEKETVESSALARAAPSSAAPPRMTQRDEGLDGPDRKALYDIAVLQVIGTVSASLMVSLAMVVSVFVLLRRLRAQLPTLVRVDAPPPTPPLVQPETPPAPDSFVEESTAQPFDLGLTYQEERRLKEEVEQRQEQAVMRTIFEDNLRLRQQLLELEAAAA
jgi:hypothetical protein